MQRLVYLPDMDLLLVTLVKEKETSHFYRGL